MYDFGKDKLKEECGIIAMSVPNDKNLAKTAYFGLNALQHRGQMSSGIAVLNDGNISCYKDFGLVTEVFNDNILSLLKGNLCLGHVSQDQNATVFSNNAQPFVVNYSKGSLAIAFNGGIRNRNAIKAYLEKNGSVFSSTSDSEIIAHSIIQANNENIVDSIRYLLKTFVGGYALAVLTQDSIIAARDQYGIRPLCIGKVDGGYVIASESCAIDLVGGDFIRDVMPGEIVILKDGEIKSYETQTRIKKASCVFEYIYFARPDSTIDDVNVYEARAKSGKILAKEHPADADIVIGVPDSGTPSGIGYAEGSKIPYCGALIKNKYTGRTFVEPSKDKREMSLKIKLNPIKKLIDGKRVVLVDDSIVRGTTMKSLISNFRNAGAKEVHLRITCPPVYNSCDFGVIAPSGSALIANVMPIEKMAESLGADSLGFLSLEGLIESLKGRDGFCTGCLNGKYPVFETTNVLLSKFSGGKYE